MQQALWFITDFGDSGLLFALTFTLSVFFYASGGKREAFLLAFSLALTSALIASMKFIFLSCGGWFSDGSVQSPSGHAALSITFYLGFAYAATSKKPSKMRIAALTLGGTFSLCIAITRYTLELHTVKEIILGLAAGLTGLGITLLMARKHPAGAAYGFTGMIILCLVVVVPLHGIHLPSEIIIRLFSAKFAPYTPCAVSNTPHMLFMSALQ